MINASLDTLMPVYDKLFNSILPLGTMPQTWYGGLITPSINREQRNDPTDYRGIWGLQLPGKTVSLYLEPTTPRTYHVFKYTLPSQISNWLFVK